MLKYIVCVLVYAKQRNISINFLTAWEGHVIIKKIVACHDTETVNALFLGNQVRPPMHSPQTRETVAVDFYNVNSNTLSTINNNRLFHFIIIIIIIIIVIIIRIHNLAKGQSAGLKVKVTLQVHLPLDSDLSRYPHRNIRDSAAHLILQFFSLNSSRVLTVLKRSCKIMDFFEHWKIFFPEECF